MEIPRVREMKFGPNEVVVNNPPPSQVPAQVLTDPEPQAPQTPVDPGHAGPNSAMLDEILAQAKQRMMRPPTAPDVEQPQPVAPPAPVYHSSGFQITTNEASQSAGESSWWKNILYFLPAMALVFMKK
jgi:hypothetical protein